MEQNDSKCGLIRVSLDKVYLRLRLSETKAGLPVARAEPSPRIHQSPTSGKASSVRFVVRRSQQCIVLES